MLAPEVRVLANVHVQHQVATLVALTAQPDASTIAHTRGDPHLDRARRLPGRLNAQLALGPAHGFHEVDRQLRLHVAAAAPAAIAAENGLDRVVPKKVLERGPPAASTAALRALRAVEQILQSTKAGES